MSTQKVTAKSTVSISTASRDSTKLGVTTRSMSKKSQAPSEEDSASKDANASKLLPPNIAGNDKSSDGNSTPSTPHSASSYSFAAPVMTTSATTLEEQIANLTRAIEGLAKHVQEQDVRITQLTNKEKENDGVSSHVRADQSEEHNEAEASAK